MAESASHCRLLVFDQSVIGDCVQVASKLLPRFREDVATFVLQNPSCSKVMKLVDLGAGWVFDESLPQHELECDFPRLMQVVADRDAKLQRYRNLQTMFKALSKGELDVMHLILEGKHNNQIAGELGISIRTVESRRANTYRKCNAASLAEMARRNGEFETLSKIFIPSSAAPVVASTSERSAVESSDTASPNTLLGTPRFES